MKKLIFLASMFAACASTALTTNPTPPVVVPPKPTDTIIYKHDTITTPGPTIYVRTIDTLPVALNLDSSGSLLPDPSGDSWAELQAVINAHQPLKLGRYTYPISKPLIVANLAGGVYGQSWCDIEGVSSAQNAPYAFTSNILPTFTNAPAIILQQCKGCLIKNLNIVGRYMLSGTLTPAQIDTLPFAKWDDGICSTNVTSPYAGIAIDPFSDPANYDSIHLMYQGLQSWYIPGMSQSGSTAVKIIGCSFQNFVAAIIVAPGWQENGELIDVEDYSFTNCRSGYCFTNAQQKTNTLYRGQVWGGVHTILDGATYGAGRGDGTTCPMVDVLNIAGYNHQFINGGTYTFSGNFNRIYAELLWRIGVCGGFASTSFTNCSFNLQWEPWTPTPDFIYWGTNTTWRDCLIRYYGYPFQRMIFNNASNKFDGGAFDIQPIVAPVNPVNANMDTSVFSNTSLAYSAGVLNGVGRYDSAGRSHTVTLHAGPGFTGWYTGRMGEDSGDQMLTTKPYVEDMASRIGVVVPVGNVTGVIGDTIRLNHLGWGIKDGDQLTVWTAKIKQEKK